jgi:hypothetical protein
MLIKSWWMKFSISLIAFLLASAPAGAKTVDEIVAELERRRASLEEISISYQLTVEQFRPSDHIALAGETFQPPASPEAISTSSVTYIRKGNRSRVKREGRDHAGQRTHQDVTWVDDETSTPASARVDEETFSLLEPPPGAPNDLSLVTLVEYWLYTGFTPKWFHLEDIYDIEYNIASHDHKTATADTNDDITTLTYQGRYVYVFDGYQLIKMQRFSTKNGPLSLSVSYSYDQDVGENFPAGVVAESFDSNGRIEAQKTISVTELVTDVSGQALQ